tara:strand:- start:152 stop:379 length:228 start_codon:yes stop_codon:yes gene_type:complete
MNNDNGMKDWLMDKANARVAEEQEQWIDEEISKVYWAFADDISDGSGERLNDYLNGPFKTELQTILREEYEAYGK